ncbi:MAG TPA: MFS transporter [Anaerolineales bacterium]|nr:MFS transporter [Anaerolineales bacterium]
MFRKLKTDATRVYLFIEIAFAVCWCLVVMTGSLYEVTIARLTPLQLVLVGTTLEISTFLFEVPTGIVADVYSRRLSIIIGYILMGLGFLVEGLFPAFLPIILAQIVWGLGYTFTSGAKQAWITDEISEESANQLFLRAARFGSIAWLFGLGATVLVGADNAAIPIRVGAIGFTLIGITLAFIMPETGFHPTPQEDRNTWQHMWHIFKAGVGAVRSQPRLVNIVFIGLFYGLYSEGFDRLGVKLLLDNFHLPILFGSNQVAFFVAMEAIGSLVSIYVIRFVEKRLDTSSSFAIGRAMLLVTGSITVAILGFALSPILALAVVSMLAVNVFRGISGPLQTTWINQKLDSKVRATVHSMFGQVDAIGQITSGPTVGFIANILSVRLAVAISGFLLAPATFFVQRANSQSRAEADMAILVEPVD